MKRKSKLLVLMLSIFLLGTYTYCAPGDDAPPGGAPGGAPGGSSSASISYTGATTISSDTTESNKTYETSNSNTNALLVSGGKSTLSKITVTKSGDSDGDDSDFYGTNAGVLAYNGGELTIKDSEITTSGAHANAVFAYGEGVINISDSTIKTSNNNSGAIMVTGGGTLTSDNVTAKTEGNSSAPIRSDRGGGTLTVNKGSYTSSGTGSPVIYSTADITVNDAKLTSTASEGVVVEGKNSVTLNNVTMEATNTKLNGNSETYKAIFIYQSMSGDADEGTATFSAKDSKITNNKGDIIFVTNTKTIINLENNELINNDSTGGLLKVSAAKWGNSGSNGGEVTLNLSSQDARGDITIDDISTLDMSMKDKSFYKGAINNKEAKEINISLSSDSIIVLTDDSYITSLENKDSSNKNIYANGHKLYVDGKEVSINESDAPDGISTEESIESTENKETTKVDDNLLFKIFGGICIVLILGIIILLIRNKKLNNKEA